MMLISRPGLFKLIQRSNKPEANQGDHTDYPSPSEGAVTRCMEQLPVS